jgi:hypothetical protein
MIRPIFGSIFFDEMNNSFIFFTGPRTFDEGRIKNYLPSLGKLLGSLTRKFGARSTQFGFA